MQLRGSSTQKTKLVTRESPSPGFNRGFHRPLGVAAPTWVGGPDDPVLITNPPAPLEAPRIDLADGQTAVWSGKTPVASVIPIVATIVVVLGLVIGWFAGWFVLATLGPVAAVLVGSSVYRITVGAHGLRVAGLLFGLPRVGVPLDQISSVEVGAVNAWSFGGVGYPFGSQRRKRRHHSVWSGPHRPPNRWGCAASVARPP